MDAPKLSASHAAERTDVVSESAEDSPSDEELEESECSEYSEDRMETASDDWDPVDLEYLEESENWGGRMMTESDDWDSEDSVDSENKFKDPEARIVMRLHIVSGSFFTTSADMEAGCPGMDAELWSKLPEDIMWRVVQFVPSAKHFQWHSVSRKWRQVLTSADFRNTVAAAPRQSEEEQRVFACATRPSGHTKSSSSSSKLKVLDINLSSFVPSCFWKPDRLYYIRAAANGLVCLCNDNPRKHLESTQYCVVNPLTRSCTVLPKPPFLPWHWLFRSTTTLTVCGGSSLWREPDWKWATYDLATGGAGGWHLAVYRVVYPLLSRWWLPPVVCAGETYLYSSGELHVAPCPGPDRPLVEVAAFVGVPSVTLLGLNPATHQLDRRNVYLVPHGHTLFFIARLVHYIVPLLDCDGGCAVFRLVRDRMEWEAVARLEVPEVERLTGLNCYKYMGQGFDCIACDVEDCRRKSGVFGACWVRDLLCCNYVIPRSRPRGFAYCLLGLNLDTGEWDLVNDERALTVGHSRVDACLPTAVDAFELRLDLFLPETSLQR